MEFQYHYKTGLWIVVFVLLGHFSWAQIPVAAMFRTIQDNSIHRTKTNWKVAEVDFYNHCKTATSDVDTINAFVALFEKMNDVHSSITYKQKQFANYPMFTDSALNYLRPLVILSMQETGIFRVHVLNEKYLYVQVPGVNAMGDQVELLAQALRDSLTRHLSEQIQGVILDLRLNGGGQLSVMLTGIAPLLGDGYLGGGVDAKGSEAERFTLEGGNFTINGNPMTGIPEGSHKMKENLPVVVLIGPNTRSSGSITAIAFKGRKSTYFIGSATAAGYTTGNQMYFWPNQIMLNLSTYYNQDRNRVIYHDQVSPDLHISGEDNFGNLLNDLKVREALIWLEKQF